MKDLATYRFIPLVAIVRVPTTSIDYDGGVVVGWHVQRCDPLMSNNFYDAYLSWAVFMRTRDIAWGLHRLINQRNTWQSKK